nr:GAF domain-containing sensor histidine kinase [Anaerolineae bacterium]
MQAAASTLDFDEVLTRTIETLHRTLGIEYLNFALPDESGAAMVVHPFTVGFTVPPEGYPRLPLDGSIIGRVYQTGEPLLVPDVRQVPYYFEVAPEVRSELAVPVRVGDQVIAVLNAESAALAAFDEDDLRLFSAVAAQLGVVLENARLYQTLQEQTNELRRAYGELQELSRLRTQLVQNVSHELRTPLSLIQGYVELLLEGNLGRVLDSQRAALEIIRQRTATLIRLIHNLTMLQAVPRAALALAPVSVVEVVQHALAEFRRWAERAGIAFQEELTAELPPVLGDRERLELVFGHLIDNAIKFSPGGGTVTIRAWADETCVYVSVTDEGIGIAREHLSRIFERFYQVDGTTRRRFGGIGVGLALVWEIVEAHGGTVEVESEPGEGSTFTVALPQAT